MKQKLILILCLLMLGTANAKSTYADGYLQPDQIYNNKMGMVITQIRVPYKNVLNQPAQYTGFMVVRNLNTNAKYKIDGASYEISMSMLQPGIYQIVTMGWEDGGFIHRRNLNTTDQKNATLLLGAFEIKPGECLYLGDIVVDRNATTEEIMQISDHSAQMLEEAKTFALDSLVARIKFYPLLKERNLIQKNAQGIYYVENAAKHG